jgi:hypothetical protein
MKLSNVITSNIDVIGYHATLIDRVESIVNNGIIPGFLNAPGQSWKAKYSDTGVYFHSMFPSHELENGYSEYENEPFVAVIKVHLKNIKSNDIIPDEDMGYSELDGLKAYRDGGSFVYLNKVSPNDILEVFIPVKYNDNSEEVLDEYIANISHKVVITRFNLDDN